MVLDIMTTEDSVPDSIEKLCIEKGMRMTEQRRVVARVLSSAKDHPDVEELYRRAHEVDPHISIATVYRTVRLFEEAGIIARHDFRDGRSRYEEASDHHHDHLIDMKTGRVLEFIDDEIEELQERIAQRLGFKLVDHRLELYGVPLEEADK
jgi:Fur family transcriptional regulator, ferric uptake regulator